MPIPDPVMAAALRILRVGLGLEQQDVAARLGVCRSTISHLERGRIELQRERFESLAERLEAPEGAVEAALAAAEVLQRVSDRELGPGTFNAQQRKVVERAVCQVARDFRVGFTASAREALIAADRVEAETLVREFLAAPPRERMELLEEMSSACCAWAVCEQLCFASQRAASNDPRRAIEISNFAFRVLDRVSGTPSWQRELEGFVWLFAANAHRAANDFRAADRGFARSRALVPERGHSGVLDLTRRLDLEASLRRDQRRFPEALALLDQALGTGTAEGAARPRLLMMKASVLEQAGEIESACSCLQESLALVDEASDRRLQFGVRLNLVVSLLHLGRTAEAADLIPQVRSLAIERGETLDLTRVLWLEGRLLAAQGSRGIARAMFAQVRGELLSQELSCDAALVALEEAAFDLEDGNFRQVQEATRTLPGLFAAQGIEREALVAIRLFAEAVERESATAQMARGLAARLLLALRGIRSNA